MISHAVPKSESPAKIKEVVYSRLILVKNHQLCIDIAPELRRKSQINEHYSR